MKFSTPTDLSQPIEELALMGMRRRPLIVPCVLVCGSVLMLRDVSLGPELIITGMVMLLAAAVVLRLKGRCLASLCCSCVLIAVCAVTLAVPRIAPQHSYLRQSIPCRIEGTVTRVLRQSPSRVTYIIEGHTDARDMPCCITTSMCTERRPSEVITTGEQRIVFARIRRPSAPALPNEVDERDIAHQIGVSFIAESASSHLVCDPPFLQRVRSQLRHWTCDLMGRHLSDTDAGVVRALALGDRSGIDREQMTMYQRTGTAHMLSVSGSHVGLMFTLILLVLSRWRGSALVFACATLIVAYVFLTGAEIPALRAAVMGIALIVARWREWDVDGLNLLAGSVLVLTIADPWSLDTASTILSVSAVAGILVLAPLWKRYAMMLAPSSSRSIAACASACSVSVAASTAVVLPSLINFEQVAVFSVIANCSVVPLLSLVFVVVPLFVLAAVVGVAEPVAQVIHILLVITDFILRCFMYLENLVRCHDYLWLIAALCTFVWWWPLIAQTAVGAVLRWGASLALIASVHLFPASYSDELWVYQQCRRCIVGVSSPDTTRMVIIGSGTDPLDMRVIQWARYRHGAVMVGGVGRWGRRMAARIQHVVVGSTHADSNRIR